MRILRNLILTDMSLLMTLGFGMAIYLAPTATFSKVTPFAPLTVLPLLGAALGGLAFVVAAGVLSRSNSDRGLALWLSAANLLIATMALLLRAPAWGSLPGWSLFLVFSAMAAALLWAGLRPSGETAAELAILRIPVGIRQALLRQIGETAAQEERNRLARDLHDSIKQQLFSINVGTAAAQERWDHDPEAVRSMLADIRRSAREAMVEMQALLQQLRPQALGSIKGFVESLREQCEALGYRSGAQVTVEVFEEIPEDRLPPGALEALFRIAQEVLANVAKHARAHHVHLRLGRIHDEWAVLEVEDDGQGFSLGEPSTGMGLRNLRERAESLRGTFQVESTPGKGTLVKVRIPLTPLRVTEPSFIEEGIRNEILSIIGSACLIVLCLLRTPPDSPDRTAIGLVAILFGAAMWGWKRKAPAGNVRLLHAQRRTRAFLVFAIGSWASYIVILSSFFSIDSWRFSDQSIKLFDKHPLAAAWVGMALWSLGEAGNRLALFHRQTRIRRSWPRWTWTLLSRYWSVFPMIALTVLHLLRHRERLITPGLEQLLCAFSMFVVLVYLFTREPREEGAVR